MIRLALFVAVLSAPIILLTPIVIIILEVMR